MTESRQGAALSVLHVGKYYPPFSGGMERFLSELVTASVELGIRTSAIVHDHVVRFPFASRAVRKTNQSDRSSRVFRVPSFGRLLFAPVSPHFPFHLNRAIRLTDPDLLDLHLPNTSAFWALLLPGARRRPWVVHWHSDVVADSLDWRLNFAYRLYRPLEQRLLKRANAIIVTSPPYLENSCALAPWKHKCRVIPLGIEASRMVPTTETRSTVTDDLWGGEGFRVLMVGRLTYYKGHEYLIRAVARVPEAQVIIVGKGDQLQRLKKLISALSLDNRVSIVGSVSDDVLGELMMNCDCLCLPSVERTEAFGVVLLEAMAHQKAVIATNVPGSGMSWVVEDRVTGLLVNPADENDLAAAIRDLASAPEKIQELGRAGLSRLRKMFTIGQVAVDTVSLYDDVIMQHSSREI